MHAIDDGGYQITIAIHKLTIATGGFSFNLSHHITTLYTMINGEYHKTIYVYMILS